MKETAAPMRPFLFPPQPRGPTMPTKKEKDKPMSTTEFNRALATLEWDYKIAAEKLGVTPRHINRLMAGKSEIPHLIGEHLRLLLKS
jgi:hypothetical protein